MGKTHLLKAIAQQLAQRADLSNVLYVPAETLCQELTTSIRQRRSEAFRERYRSAGALLIDDLAVLAGRTARAAPMPSHVAVTAASSVPAMFSSAGPTRPAASSSSESTA